MFSQWFERERRAKFWVFSTLMNSTQLQLTKFFTKFHSKFAMPPKTVVVSLEKLDNFYIGGILECLGEILRTRQKFRRMFKGKGL
jgi:hypothetical protein